MDPHIQTFERITELVSLLSSGEGGATIREISRKTETSPAQTREDLAQLHKLGIRLYPDEIASSLSMDDDRYDDEPLELDTELPVEHALLFLNNSQRVLFFNQKVGRMLVKDTSLSVSEKVHRHCEQIEKAIRGRHYIRFKYRSPVIGHNEDIEIAPLKLFHHTTNNLYYCISADEKDNMFTYRLDRILFDVHILRKKHSKTLSKEIASKLDYVWGAAFENNSEPVHVKLEIHADTPNILEKIRSETRMRRHASIRKEGNCYIYEDDVIGLSSMRTWILSYGSSVKVLEPESLARRILSSSQLRLLNYEDGSRFHQPGE